MKLILGDSVTFPALQALLVLLVVYALLRGRGWFVRDTGASASIKRGKESWGHFHLMYGLVSVVFVEVINTAETLKGFKTLITVLDLLALFYLCFFNAWFRNKIIGIIVASQNMEER